MMKVLLGESGSSGHTGQLSVEVTFVKRHVGNSASALHQSGENKAVTLCASHCDRLLQIVINK
jgi:hypothetical protein